ncbi:MAG: FtsX-like permease family protein [Gemmatimonadetes bacterium]|nr:FtsX-like permease family protein [Gemmatimonadota bacterium]
MRDVRSGLDLLMGAVILLLLVACVNVAHLFMARGLGRGRELAVRRALGASTPSLVGHLAVESLLLGLAGGLGGVVLAFVGLRAFMGLNPDSLPRAAEIGLDPRILAFAAALSVITALVFGLLPALRTMGRGQDPTLRPSARGGTANRNDQVLRHGLIVAEVAVSLVLVASASLLLRTFVEVQRQEPGFDTAGVWTIPLTPREVDSPASYRLQMDEVRERVAGVVGVRSAAYGLTMPFELTGGGRCCWRSTMSSVSSGDETAPWIHPVSPEYFATLGVELLHGASWSAVDATSSPIPAVVNEAFAIELFGSAGGALGQVLLRAGEGSMQFLVTGVARNTRYFGLDAEPEPNVFIPIEVLPFPITRSHLAVRVSAADPGLGGRLREAVWAAAPTLPVPTVRSMEGWMDHGTARRRFDSALFAAFGLVALLLAAGGLYGTLLYVASQRRRELAIRQALGASRAKIERWMLRGGLLVATAGVVLGLLGSWGAARFLESRLWGVEPSDPLALFGAAGLLLLVAAVASWLPARWAGRTDPMEALQAE